MPGTGVDQRRGTLGAAGRTRSRTCHRGAGRGSGARHAHRDSFSRHGRHLLCRESDGWARRICDALGRRNPARHHRNAVHRGARQCTPVAAGGGISSGGCAPLFPGLERPYARRHCRAVRRAARPSRRNPSGLRSVARNRIHHGPRRTPARARHLRRQTYRVVRSCRPRDGAYRTLVAGKRQARRNGAVNFEETRMRKISMAALTLAFLATLAHAEDYLSPTAERLRLSLGVIYTSNQTSMQIDSSGGVAGTPINAENQFGLDKSDFEPKFQAMVRASERHRLRFDFFEVNRTASTTITQPIIFRNVVLQSGDPLNSNLSISTLSLTYEYSFLHGEKSEGAAPLGVTETDISARARV